MIWFILLVKHKQIVPPYVLVTFFWIHRIEIQKGRPKRASMMLSFPSDVWPQISRFSTVLRVNGNHLDGYTLILHPWWQLKTRNGTKAHFAPKDPGENHPPTRYYVPTGTAVRVSRWSRRNPWRRAFRDCWRSLSCKVSWQMFCEIWGKFPKILWTCFGNMMISPGGFWRVSRYLLNLLGCPRCRSWNASREVVECWHQSTLIWACQNVSNPLSPHLLIIKKSHL